MLAWRDDTRWWKWPLAALALLPVIMVLGFLLLAGVEGVIAA